MSRVKVSMTGGVVSGVKIVTGSGFSREMLTTELLKVSVARLGLKLMNVLFESTAKSESLLISFKSVILM